MPIPPDWDREHGFQCVCPPNEADVHQCSHRNLIEGSAVFVTSVFGMAIASLVVRDLAGEGIAPTLVEQNSRDQ